MEEHLTCNICFNLLREPKDLDCPHVFCLECLQNYLRTIEDDRILSCPECRYLTLLPRGGVQHLKTNLRLKNMINEYSKSKTKNAVALCSTHKGERQHFFCVTCNVTVCRDCLVLEHMRPQHEIKELKAVVEMRKAELEAKTSQVEDKIKKWEKRGKELADVEKEIDEAEQQALRKIRKRKLALITAVENEEKILITQIKDTCSVHKMPIKRKQKRNKEKVTQLRKIKTATRNVVETAADQVCLEKHTALVDKMNELCGIKDQMAPPGFGSFLFKNLCRKSSFFGDATLHGKMIRQLTRVKDYGPYRGPGCAAVTKTGLVALICNVNKAAIVNSVVNGQYKYEFSLAEHRNQKAAMREPFKVAITSTDKFLVTYVHETDSTIAQIYSQTGQYEKTLTGVGRLITTTPDDMIVTAGHRGASHVITVHQPDGELIRKHHVHSESTQGQRRWRDIASNGKQITLAMYDPDNSDHDRVYALDFTTGQVVWTVDIRKPQSICYDNKSSSVLVAHGIDGQGHIDQHCSNTGQLITRLQTGFGYIYAMMVTHDDKLVVADHGAIKMFDFQKTK